MQASAIETLEQFIAWLESQAVDYALIGGLAAGYWGEERFTKDIDFTVILSASQWAQLLSIARTNSDITIDQICEEAGYDVPHLLRIRYKQYPIDLLISLTPFQESLVQRAVTVTRGKSLVRMATPEDVIVTKLIANRPQDIVDVSKIVRRLSDLDQDYILHWSKIWGIEERWLKIKDQT